MKGKPQEGLQGMLILLEAKNSVVRRWLGRWVGAMLVVAVCLFGSIELHAADAGLDRAIRHAERIVVTAGTVVMAASASQEGHWTFVNTKGERFTAATPGEMAHMPAVLAAGAAFPNTPLLLVVDDGSVFRSDTALKSLPAFAAVQLSTATGVYKLDTGPPRTVAVTPKLRIELSDRASFDEILAQLDRAFGRFSPRVIALVPGASAVLPSRPALEAQEIAERIDPYRLADALSGVVGQTVLVTGRLAAGLLYFQDPSGSERSLNATDLIAAAARHNVNLLVLETASGRQPGVRNWLWLKAAVAGVEAVGAHPTLGALVGRFATEAMPLTLRSTAARDDRVTLVGSVGAPTKSTVGGFVDALSRAASGLSNDVTGQIEPTAIHMYLTAAELQRELDRRIFASIPSGFTWGYIALLVIGLIGAPTSWRWWSQLWPPEQRAEYSNAFGYQAARAAKLAVFAALVMPVTGLAAAPYTLIDRIRARRHPA